MLREHEGLLDDYMTLISDRVDTLSRKLVFLQFKTIRKKLVSYLLLLPRQIGKSRNVSLTLTLTELADFFAVEHPSLSKVFGDLVREGLIRKLDARNIELLDEKKLIRASTNDGSE